MSKFSTAPETKEKFEVSMKKEIKYNPVYLVETEMLRVEKVETVYRIKRRINPTTNYPVGIVAKDVVEEKKELLEFKLIKATPKELAELRKKCVPAFILKYNGEMYYTEILKDLSFINANILGYHQCASFGLQCRRLSAASDEKGGCQKVRDRIARLEAYPWIKSGYETINTDDDLFVVADCLHYVRASSCRVNTSFNVAD